MQHPLDYYEILGVTREASGIEIRRAFRVLAKALHPDSKHLESEVRTDYDFQTINEAYETLKDPEKRKAYDEALSKARSVVSPETGKSKSSGAFAAGMAIGLAIAFAGIGFSVYSGRLTLGNSIKKGQDSLSRLMAAGEPKVRVGHAPELEKAAKPAPVKTSIAGADQATPPVPQMADVEKKQASAEVKDNEPADGKSQSRLRSAPPPPTLSQQEQKIASLQGDSSTANDAGDVLPPSSQVAVKQQQFTPKPPEGGAGAPPDAAALSDRIEATTDKVQGPLPPGLVALIRSAIEVDGPSKAALGARKPETGELINQRIEEVGDGRESPDIRANQSARDKSTSQPAGRPRSVSPQSSTGSPKRDAFVDFVTGPRDHETMVHLRPGGGLSESFRDCPDCPEMVLAPAGQFAMGARAGDDYNHLDEARGHHVTIQKPFAVSRYEISNENWRACIRGGSCRAAQLASFLGRPEMSVKRLSWYDAKGYVEWLSEETGKTYRLPTEAEWEYVARAGAPVTAGGSTNDRDHNRLAQVNYELLPFQSRLKLMRSLSVNAWGLRNLGGHTVEWVEDCWHSNYARAPGDGSAWLSTAGGDCSHRVVRGGLLSADFSALSPSARAKEHADAHASALGFRVVREIYAPMRTANH